MKIRFAVYKSLLFLCLILLFLTAAGCGRRKAEISRHKVAVIVKSTQSTYWKTVFAGAAAAAAEYNLEVTCQGPKMEEDDESQNRMIETAVREGAQAIVFSAVDFNANARAVDFAADQGVKIVIIDSDVNSEKVSVRIGSDNYAAGEKAGEAALLAEEEELYIGIVNYDVHSENGQQREKGFRNVIGRDDRVREIHTINVVSATEEAKQGTKQLLEAYPKTNVIVTFNEWTSLGVGWAIRELGRAEDIRVVAFDSNAVSVGMLESGEVDALIVQSPYAMGYLGIEAANELIAGQEPQQERMDTEIKLITRENMFEPESQRMLFSFDD